VRPTRKAGVRARHRAAGQVLPAAIFLLLACAAFLYWTVNSGQMVTEKMRLTNAADAAAYSAAVVHARALNLDAYTNRAIVANQVAIAQTLSLVSWADYFVDVFCNVSTLGDGVMETAIVPDEPEIWARLAAVVAGSAMAQWFSGTGACNTAAQVNDGWNRVASIAITGFNGASVVLATSQRLMHVPLEAALFARSQEAAQRAVDAIGSAMDADVVPVSYDPANLGEAGTFVRLHSGDDRSRLRDVVLASRDAFTTRRDWTVRNERSAEQHRIQRRGSTTLSDLDTWDANDSMVHRWRSLGRGGWRERRRLIGQGTADTADTPTSESVWLARTYNFRPLYSGLPAVHDLRDGSTDPARSRYGVSVHVVKRRADTLTSQHAAQAGPSGRLAVFGAAAAPTTMAALARAEVVFNRPPRDDGRTEYANLFSPFWQVRLVSPTTGDRAFAAARQGNVALPAP
jgi:hypothetical protein